jgi:hypothetical protein
MSGLDKMKQRFQYAGGVANGRNREGKLRSFHTALKNSYQSEWITLHKGEENEKRVLCLINPSRLTEEFDKKVLSIDFEHGVKEGDVFYWDRTERYWMVNLQQHTEEAYFRGTITRCEHQAVIDDKLYWITLRGPLETDADWISKHNLYINKLNYSMRMEITKNKQTMDYFSRFKIIKIQNSYKDEDGTEYIEEHRWQVVATDKYSSNTVIEVYLNEYADNAMEDAMIQDNPVNPDPELPYIDGPQFVNVYDESLVYTIQNLAGGKFVVNSSLIKINEMNETSISLDILTGKSGKFTIHYVTEAEDIELNVEIKSF